MLPETTKQRIKQEAVPPDAPIYYSLPEAGMWNVGYTEGFIAGATAEAEKAQQLADALEELLVEPYSVGKEGCTWGDSNYDSLSAAAGYNKAIDNITKKVTNALQKWRGEK